ncbi:MAG TPA: hypothetical protein VER17_14565 [Tepidisphaeraceae bacterium]|nr:hypothetical protein [Tepidisphaeraceae bacterium]
MTINDGATAIVGFPLPVGAPPTPSPSNWLAVRHDTGVISPDASAAAGSPIPKPGRRGNVAFADGHVAFTGRAELHAVGQRRWDPTR